jgi:hypothetical protein
VVEFQAFTRDTEKKDNWVKAMLGVDEVEKTLDRFCTVLNGLIIDASVSGSCGNGREIDV